MSDTIISINDMLGIRVTTTRLEFMQKEMLETTEILDTATKNLGSSLKNKLKYIELDLILNDLYGEIPELFHTSTSSKVREWAEKKEKNNA